MQFDFVYMISVTLERDILQLDAKKQKNGENEQSNKQQKSSFTPKMQIRIKTAKKPRAKNYYIKKNNRASSSSSQYSSAAASLVFR
jgi:hypothetical protein